MEKVPEKIDFDAKHWHALYVRSRSERKVLTQLEEMGVEAYLPLITLIKQWSDRRKKVEEPLFKSYVFIAACGNTTTFSTSMAWCGSLPSSIRPS